MITTRCVICWAKEEDVIPDINVKTITLTKIHPQDRSFRFGRERLFRAISGNMALKINDKSENHPIIEWFSLYILVI